jgi:UDP-glucose 4-epimerase
VKFCCLFVALGYIGSHTVLELLESGYNVVVVDNLCNSTAESIKRVEKITGKKVAGIHNLDLRDEAGLDDIFSKYAINSVIHFASLKAVGESVQFPLKYYENNIQGLHDTYAHRSL